MPGDVQRVALGIRLPRVKRITKDRMLVAERYQPLAEAEEVSIFLSQSPIEPVEWAVMAIGIVVAQLGPADLIAHEQHRDALAEKENRQGIANLPTSESDDCRVI